MKEWMAVYIMYKIYFYSRDNSCFAKFRAEIR